jgi:hypothetical protein
MKLKDPIKKSGQSGSYSSNMKNYANMKKEVLKGTRV